MASVGFVSVSALGLLVAMFLADGFKATTYELQDASVWATRADGLVGRINTLVVAQDAWLRPDIDGPDVVQDGHQVLIVDPAGSLVGVDVRDVVTIDPPTPIPAGSTVDLAGGTLALRGPDGAVWIGEVGDPGSVAEDFRDPDLELGAEGALAVGRGGQVVAHSPRDGELVVIDGEDRRSTDVATSGEVQVTMVGDQPVVLDVEAGELVLPGGEPVDLSRWGSDTQLQLPGDDDRVVLVATDSALVAVPLDGGDPTTLEERDGLGAPARPVRIAGCSYGAWTGGAVEVVHCDGMDPVEHRIEGAVGELRFRVNRDHVALNDLDHGIVYYLVDDEIRVIELGEDQRDGDDDEEEAEELDRSDQLDLTEENEPPEAHDDQFGARPALPAVLTVLDNDVDRNGDVLVITEVGAATPDDLEVAIVGQGQAIQVRPPADASGTYTFSYTITDGREAPNSDSATVTVRVTPDGENHPPQQKEHARARFEVESGKSASYDVLQDWWDPDGDPIFLEGASAEGTSDTVQTLPSGVLTFVDSGVGTGAKQLEVTVRDAPAAPGTEPESATGRVTAQVEPPRGRIPPVARPDHRTTVVGSTLVIAPLENDSDGNGDELHVGSLLADHLPSDRVTVSLSPADDTISFRASVAGSYVFGYEVTDGVDSSRGLIRVDVVEAAENRPPAPGLDLVVLPVHATRTVDLLLNDVDPDGDVLVVQSVDVPADAPLTAQLLEHRRLRVSSPGALARPVVIDYVVSDGQAEATGQVFVVSTTAHVENRPPVLGPDAVSVRIGDVVDIPVLANDVDPEGDELRILPDLAVGPAEGQGLAFVSGSVLRYVAPERPMTVRLAYTVEDGGLNRPTGQVTITVRGNAENAAPVARTVEARVLAGNSVKIRVPLAGVDPDGDSVELEGIGSTAPRLGRIVTPVGSDSITYEAFDSERGGTDTFSYRIVDRQGARAEGIVRVGVAPRSRSNGAPQPMTDKVEVRPGATVLVPALANDYDPDGDPLSYGDPAVEPPSDGVMAEVDRNDPSKLRITAPDSVGPVRPLVYRVTDGWGATAFGTVEIVVKDDASGLPPVARDDRALPPRKASTTEVEVDVTANDEDPDGSVDELEVRVVGDPGGVSLRGQRLVVSLEPSSRLVVYEIEDPQGHTARAIVRVPAAGGKVDRPPVQVDRGVSKVVTGETLRIDVTDHVEDPEGRPVRLTTGDRVSATNSNGAPLVEDERTLAFTSAEGYVGPASITFEVTDGDAADTGNRLVVSLPIEVEPRPGTNTPPSFRDGVVLTVAPKEEAQRLDLRPLVVDPDPGDRDRLRFDLGRGGGAPAGVEVALDGSHLRAVADAEATPGTTGTVRIVVSDSKDETEGTVEVRVARSSRPLPTCSQAVIDDAEAGRTVVRDVLRDCFNPFPDEDLELVTVATEPSAGSVTARGGSVEFTANDGFVGRATVRYEVADALGRTAAGLVSITVRDVPGRPSPPTVVDVSSRKVVLTWQPPQPNGAEIEHYEVRSSHGTTRCPATTCTIDGLQNDARYRFSVRAHNRVGDGPWSDESAEARPDQRPEAPTGVELVFDEDAQDPTVGGQLTARWTAARSEGSAVSAYEIRISPSPPHGPAVQRVGAVTSYLWRGLSNGTAYRVQVRAINAAQTGPGDWSVESNAEVPAKVPDQPARPSAQRVDDPLGELIQVSWSAPAENGDAISSYRLQAFRAGSSTPTKTLELGGSTVSTVVDVDDVESSYEFVVTATNKAGASSPSERSVAVQAPSRPARVTSVSASDRNGTTGLDRRATVTFARPFEGGVPITRYEVRINGGAIRSFTSGVSSPNPVLTVDGLTNGQTYRFAVRACNETGCQEQFSPDSPNVVPYGPVGTPSVSTSKPNATSVRFTWSPPVPNGRAIDRVQIRINGGGWENVAASGSRTVGNGYGQTHSIQVRAVDQAGQVGPARSASASTNPPPTPRVTISFAGDTVTPKGCENGCRYVIGSVEHFAPNRTYRVSCRDNDGEYFAFDFTTTAAGTGGWGTGWCRFGHGASNPTYVVIDGVRSNSIYRSGW